MFWVLIHWTFKLLKSTWGGGKKEEGGPQRPCLTPRFYASSYFTPIAAPISAVRPASSLMLPLTSAPRANTAAIATKSPAMAARYSLTLSASRPATE